MVAKIKIGTSIRGILHYNENKVIGGEAKLILASGFAGEIEKMDFNNKLNRFQHLIALKPTVKTNALHISLNFDASESISNSKMQEIATAYMEKIGFGDQPFLVYKHTDAGHQHFHIATTCIQRNGESIKTHNIGRVFSEPARKEIEKEFNLVVAEKKVVKHEPNIKLADLEKAKYGKSPTKRQISNVLSGVVNEYMFTSLPEFNAVLKQFNVIADRGSEDSEMFQKKGLVYSLIDKAGDKIGIPIKASSFYHKCTLNFLEKKFERNQYRRKFHKQNLVDRLRSVLLKYDKVTKGTLIKELKALGIDLILRENANRRVYGVTFIDHQKKSVFNGSDLGKLYSANALSEYISSDDRLKTFLKPANAQYSYLKNDHTESNFKYLSQTKPTNYLSDPLDKSQSDYAPIIKRKRKKRRQGLTLNN